LPPSISSIIGVLQEAGDGAWDDMKKGMEKSWTELRGAFSNAFAKFK
jgi:hypothetical protein